MSEKVLLGVASTASVPKQTFSTRIPAVGGEFIGLQSFATGTWYSGLSNVFGTENFGSGGATALTDLRKPLQLAVIVPDLTSYLSAVV